MLELKLRKSWTGDYRGIRFEVSHHTDYDDNPCWCFYLYVHPLSFHKSIRKEWNLKASHRSRGVSVYDYWDSPWGGLEWHGGCTYYEKSSSKIKVGCDYQHWFDHGRYYTESSVAEDAKRCIDSLHHAVQCRYGTPLRIRSWWDGTYHPESELEAYNKKQKEKYNERKTKC